MVRPALRSRSLKRHKTRLPGNTSTIHYEKVRPKKAHCPITGDELHGVPRLRPAQVRRLPKSQRSPNRYYGGRISPGALVAAIRKKVLSDMTPKPE
jgi:large subunit ribosomal protein L34e